MLSILRASRAGNVNASVCFGLLIHCVRRLRRRASSKSKPACVSRAKLSAIAIPFGIVVAVIPLKLIRYYVSRSTYGYIRLHYQCKGLEIQTQPVVTCLVGRFAVEYPTSVYLMYRSRLQHEEREDASQAPCAKANLYYGCSLQQGRVRQTQ